MADEQVQKFSLDASQGIAEITKIVRAYDGMTNATIDVIKSQVSFNSSSGKVLTTIKALINGTKDFTAALTQVPNIETGEIVTSIATSVKESYVKAVSEADKGNAILTNKLLGVAKASEKTKTIPIAQESLGGTDNHQFAVIESAANELDKEIVKCTLDSRDLRAILKALSADPFITIKAGAEGVQKAFIQLKNLTNNLPGSDKYLKNLSSSLIQDRTTTLKDQTVLKTDPTNLARNLEPRAIKDASIPELSLSSAAGRRLTKSIQKYVTEGFAGDTEETINRNLETIFQNLGSKQFGKIPAEAHEIAKAYLDVTKTLDNLGAAAGKSKAAQRQLLNVPNVKSALSKAFDTSSIANAGEKDIARLQKRIRDVVNLFAALPGQLSKNDFNNIFRSLLSGTETTFTGVKGKLAEFIRETQQAHNTVQVNAKKKTDELAETERVKTDTKSFTRQTLDILGPVPSGASLSSTQNFKKAIIDVSSEAAKSKLTFQQFDQIAQVALSGKVDALSPEFINLEQKIVAAQLALNKLIASAGKLPNSVKQAQVKNNKDIIQSIVPQPTLVPEIDSSKALRISSEFNRQSTLTARAAQKEQATPTDISIAHNAAITGSDAGLPANLINLREQFEKLLVTVGKFDTLNQNALKKASEKAQQAADEAKRLQQEKDDKVNRITFAQFTKAQLDPFGFSKSGSNEDQESFRKSLIRVSEETIKAEGTTKDLDDIIQRVFNRDDTILEKRFENIRNAVIAARQELDQLNANASKTPPLTATQKRTEAVNLGKVSQFQFESSTSVPTLSKDVDPTKANDLQAEYTKAFLRIGKAAQQAGFDAGDLQKALQFSLGNIPNIEDRLLPLVPLFQRITSIVGKFGATNQSAYDTIALAAKKAADEAQKLADIQAKQRQDRITSVVNNARANTVSTELPKQFPLAGRTATFSANDAFTGTPFTNTQAISGSTASIERMQKNFVSISESIRESKYNLKEFNTALAHVQAGNLNVFQTPSLEAARQDVVKLTKDYENFQKTIDSAADDFVNQEKKKQAAAEAGKAALEQQLAIYQKIQAQAATKAALPGAFTDVQTTIEGKKGFPEKLDVAGVERLRASYLALANQVAAGKITIAELSAEFDNINKKKITVPTGNADIENMRRSLVSIAGEFESAKKKAESFGGTLVTTVGVIKLFISQELHSIIAKISTALGEASKAASEFGIEISLIQTITQDLPESSDAWAASLRALSDELGRPINEVAGAAYESLSNQITAGKDDTEEFLKTAITFGRTVKANSVDSVNLLSSAINGYGKSVSDAENISAVFFNTIDYGRIKASDLSNTFGRTISLGRGLNVSFEETAAALAALTLQGQHTSEAQTLLNNVFSKLQKPNPATKDFLKSQGFDSGAELVKIKGFAGALDLIQKAVADNNTEFSDLFPELRALRGILGLTGDGGKKFADILNESKNSLERFKEAAKITELPAGKQFENEFNRIRNVLTVDFATEAQRVFLEVSNAVGGLANAFKTLSKFIFEVIQVFGGFTAGFYAIEGSVAIVTVLAGFWADLGTKITLATVATNIFGATTKLAFAATGIGALIAAVTAFRLEMIRAEQQARTLRKTIDEQNQKKSEEQHEKYTVEIVVENQKFKAALKDVETIIGEATVNMRIALNNVFDKASERAKELASILKDAFSQVVDILSEGVSNLKSAYKDAAKAPAEIRKQNVKILDDASENKFQRQLNDVKAQESLFNTAAPGVTSILPTPSEAQISLVTKRYKELEKARIAAYDKNTLEGVEEATQLYKEQYKLLENLRNEFSSSHFEFAGKARQEPNKAQQFQNVSSSALQQVAVWEAKIKALVEEQVALRERAAQIQTAEAERLRQKYQDAQKELDEINRLFEKLNKVSILDKEGNLPKGDTTKTQGEKVAEKSNEIRSLSENITTRINALGDTLFKNSPEAKLNLQAGLFESSQKAQENLRNQFTAFGKGKEDEANAKLNLEKLQQSADDLSAANERLLKTQQNTTENFNKLNERILKTTDALRDLIPVLSKDKVPNSAPNIFTSGLFGKDLDFTDQAKLEGSKRNIQKSQDRLAINLSAGEIDAPIATSIRTEIESIIKEFTSVKELGEKTQDTRLSGVFEQTVPGPKGQGEIRLIDSLNLTLKNAKALEEDVNTRKETVNIPAELRSEVETLRSNLLKLIPPELIQDSKSLNTQIERGVVNIPQLTEYFTNLLDSLTNKTNREVNEASDILAPGPANIIPNQQIKKTQEASTFLESVSKPLIGPPVPVPIGPPVPNIPVPFNVTPPSFSTDPAQKAIESEKKLQEEANHTSAIFQSQGPTIASSLSSVTSTINTLSQATHSITFNEASISANSFGTSASNAANTANQSLQSLIPTIQQVISQYGLLAQAAQAAQAGTPSVQEPLQTASIGGLIYRSSGGEVDSKELIYRSSGGPIDKIMYRASGGPIDSRNSISNIDSKNLIYRASGGPIDKLIYRASGGSIISDDSIENIMYRASGGPISNEKSSNLLYRVSGGPISNEPQSNGKDVSYKSSIDNLLYRNSGGSVPDSRSIFRSRGTDTVPAMLTPNEFVVSTLGTSKFYRELVLMNQGKNPFEANYYSQGFAPQVISVGRSLSPSYNYNRTNNSAGDTNVHMNINVHDNKKTNLGRQIGSEIQREIRRGTVRFK